MSIELLKERRSIRRYESRQLPQDILDQILEAGTYAPTGMNRQSPVMVAVQDPEVIRLMEKVRQAISEDRLLSFREEFFSRYDMSRNF